MKKVLQGIAILTHPIFLPLLSLIIYAPLVASLGSSALILSSVWIGFVYLFLPLLFFKVIRHINLAEPNLVERKSIYKAYTAVNVGFAIVVIFIIPSYISFFLGAALMHAFLWFCSYIELKASWHAAAWTFLIGAGLMILFNYQFVGLSTMIYTTVLVWAIVITTRYIQKAHTSLELLVGSAIGLLSSLLILFY